MPKRINRSTLPILNPVEHKLSFMKKVIKEKLAMYGVVGQLIEKNETSWQSIPAFGEKFSNYISKLNQLKTLATSQIQIVKGNTPEKLQLKKELVSKARITVGVLTAYASHLNNSKLLAQLPRLKRQLEYASTTTLFSNLETIIEKAGVHQQELGVFGLTEADTQNLIQLRDEYMEVVFKPRVGIATRKQITAQLNELVDELDALLELSLDQLMQVVGQSNPVLYQKYLNMRNIVNLATHHKKPSQDDAPDSETTFES